MPETPTGSELEYWLKVLGRETKWRKQAEIALQESEDRLRIIYKYAPDIYFMLDLKGNLIDGNKAAQEISGYSGDEYIGKNIAAMGFIPPDQAAKAAKLLALSSEGKPTGPEEFILLKKDGGQIDVEVRTYPVEIHGEPVVLVIARDITERKKYMEQLRKSEENFRFLVESFPVGISIIDPDGGCKYLNPKFTNMFGYSSGDISSNSDWFKKAFPDPDYRKKAVAAWKKDLKASTKGELRKRKFLVTCKDGATKTVLFRPVSMKTGDQFIIYENSADPR